MFPSALLSIGLWCHFLQSYLLPHRCCGAFIRISLFQLEFLVSPLRPSLRGFLYDSGSCMTTALTEQWLLLFDFCACSLWSTFRVGRNTWLKAVFVLLTAIPKMSGGKTSPCIYKRCYKQARKWHCSCLLRVTLWKLLTTVVAFSSKCQYCDIMSLSRGDLPLCFSSGRNNNTV